MTKHAIFITFLMHVHQHHFAFNLNILLFEVYFNQYFIDIANSLYLVFLQVTLDKFQ
jgi:hypothetical protein